MNFTKASRIILVTGIAFVNLIWIANVQAKWSNKTDKKLNKLQASIIKCNKASKRLRAQSKIWHKFVSNTLSGLSRQMGDSGADEPVLRSAKSFLNDAKEWRQAKDLMSAAADAYDKNCKKITGQFKSIHKGLKKK